MADTRPAGFAGEGVSAASDGLAKVADTVRKFREGHSAVGSGVRDDALALVKNGIADGRLVVHLPVGARLTAASAQVNAGSGDTFVSIPIRGGGLIAPSTLVVQIGGSGTVHASEMQFAPTGPTSGEMTMWLDGALDQHVVAANGGVATAAGTTVLAATPVGEVQPMSWWDDFTQCLTDHGVPSWVAATISAVCGLAGIAVQCAVGVALWYANAILECYGA